MPKDKSLNYKKTYDYPKVKGTFICTKCKESSKLPANYCSHCGKELEENQKRGNKS